jgi:hypothetical protein
VKGIKPVRQIITLTITVLLCIMSIIPLFCVNVLAYSGGINVFNPTSGTYYEGNAISISWSSYDAGSYVTIELYKDGSYQKTINSYTFNDGSYYWTIPSDLSSSSNYRIKITSYSNSSIYDYSQYFTIQMRSITVSFPTSNTNWYTGETYSITWDSENIGSYVRIYCYIGSSYYTISSYTNNDGTYQWTIADSYTTGTNCRIQIRSYSYSNVYDYSGYFSIKQRTISLSLPSGGETWYTGETHTITWESENAGDNVDIELYKNGYKHLTIESNVDNDGSYQWKIPDSIYTNSKYQINVKSSSYSNINDYSSYFYIGARTISITYPYEGTTFYEGETYTITWESENIGNIVDIELYKDGYYYEGSFCYYIAQNTTNNGIYEWTVPSGHLINSSYRIKIISKFYTNIYKYSNYFCIYKRILNITLITDGETWNKGDTITITWDSENIGDYVNIDLYKNGDFYYEITPYLYNYGSYEWTIPNGLEAGANYSIKISSSSNNDVYVYSQGYITIEENQLYEWIKIILIVIAIAAGAAIAIILFLKYKKPKTSEVKGNAEEIIVPQPLKIKTDKEELTDEEYDHIWEN